jgi:hypothetical protein
MEAKWSIAAVAVVIALAPACKEKGKESAAKAVQDAATLAEQTDKDVAEIERGLPDGAKKLGALWANGADPRADVQGVRQTLIKVRREVPDLNIAKSTFFAVADDKGVAIRNDLEQDVMAGLNLPQIFPDLSKALGGDFVVTQGAFPGPSSKNGPEKDWLAAQPIKIDGGKVVGLYVTGWTYRLFARHLQEVLRAKMAEALRTSGDTGKMPIFYVGVFDKSGVYTAPLTPQIDEKALVDADIVGKTASGPAQGTVNIDDRDFGWAAKRTPKLGPETGVVVLRSEL